MSEFTHNPDYTNGRGSGLSVVRIIRIMLLSDIPPYQSEINMSSFTKKVTPYIRKEFHLAVQCKKQGNMKQEFRHLENAHVLGQSSTYWHTLTHAKMLIWAIQNKSTREFFGQILRIVGAATKTAIGLVPEGNTGGSNISPFKQLPVPAEFQRIIAGSKK